ncbi:MAG TPA: hypothetical protein VJH34_04470 [archaeon]|nr:hypothetical protein [archaeon]
MENLQAVFERLQDDLEGESKKLKNLQTAYNKLAGKVNKTPNFEYHATLQLLYANKMILQNIDVDVEHRFKKRGRGKGLVADIFSMDDGKKTVAEVETGYYFDPESPKVNVGLNDVNYMGYNQLRIISKICRYSTIRERGHGTESYDFGLIVNHKSVGKSHYGELTIPYIFLLPPKLRNPKLIEAIAKRASMMAENSKKTNDPYNMNGVNKSNLSNGRLDFVGYIDGTNVKERNIGDMISGFYRK